MQSEETQIKALEKHHANLFTNRQREKADADRLAIEELKEGILKLEAARDYQKDNRKTEYTLARDVLLEAQILIDNERKDLREKIDLLDKAYQADLDNIDQNVDEQKESAELMLNAHEASLGALAKDITRPKQSKKKS